MRSSGPQPAVGGRWFTDLSVMSMPITAKSPDSSSKMSGHPLRAMVCAPLAWGSGPILRRNIVFLLLSVGLATETQSEFTVADFAI